MPATLRQMDIGFQANLYESQNPTRKWLHNTRRAWVLSKLESFTSPCARYLEVGIGCGVYTEWMARHGFVTGLDINEDFVLAANFLRNVDARVGDITQETKYDSEFDIAVCSEVIEHVVNSQAALNNMFRALKSNGLLILTTPNRFSTMELFARLLRFKPVSALARWVYGEPVDDLGHVNRLTRAALRKQIEMAGFEVVERYDVALYLPVVAEFGGSLGASVCRWGAEVLRRSDYLSHLLWTQCWVLRKPAYADV